MTNVIEQIKELEKKFTDSHESVNAASQELAEREHIMLKYARVLMPLQNSYLSNIIKSLQARLEQSEKLNKSLSDENNKLKKIQSCNMSEKLDIAISDGDNDEKICNIIV